MNEAPKKNKIFDNIFTLTAIFLCVIFIVYMSNIIGQKTGFDEGYFQGIEKGTTIGYHKAETEMNHLCGDLLRGIVHVKCPVIYEKLMNEYLDKNNVEDGKLMEGKKPILTGE
jgi:hypothetical protein